MLMRTRHWPSIEREVTERVSDRLVRLPLYSQLTSDEQARVIDGVISYNLVAA